jgi:hypothetical protein
MRLTADLVTGALIGYVSSRAMDAATSAFFAHQGEASKAREKEIAPDGTLVEVGRAVGSLAGRELPPERAAHWGLATHRTLGTTYGVIAALLVRRGVPPLVAGPVVGGAAWVVIDEGLSLPTFRRYLPASHARGVVGHGTWGATAGLLLAVTAGRREKRC